MAALLDVIASILFGGTIMMIILTANDIAAESQATHSGDMLVQEMLTSTAQLVEGELRNMGFGVPEGTLTVLRAEESTIHFLADIDRNGVIDTVRYSLGDTTEMSDTQNELDRPLKRQINHGAVLNVGSVTTFRFRYMTRESDILPLPVPSDRLDEIHMVEVSMEVQNPYAPTRDPDMVQSGQRNALYSTSLWQQTRLASQNTRR
jgi:hypothetical protein